MPNAADRPQQIDTAALLNKASGWDAYPVVKLRPLLTPPRTAVAQPDPELFVMWCPNHRKLEIVDDQFSKFPAVALCNGQPTVVVLGQGIFVGQHLLVPAKRERLLQVLTSIYGADFAAGANRRWVESPGIRSTWQPASQQTLDQFRDVGLFGRRKAPVPNKPPARVDHPEPELVE